MAMEDSSAGRLVGALVSPVKTFRSLAERPTWGLALLVTLLVTGSLAYVAGLRTDYRDVIVQGAKEKGKDVDESQLEPAINMMQKAGPAISAAGAPVAVALVMLLVALVYWVVFKLVGAEFSYVASLAVSLHSGMPLVISALLSLPVVLSRPRLGFADLKSGSFLQSNLAFLAPADAKAWLTALYASVDFFSLWGLVLSILGFKALTRLTTKPVALVVVLVWLLLVGVRVGLAALR